MQTLEENQWFQIYLSKTDCWSDFISSVSDGTGVGQIYEHLVGQLRNWYNNQLRVGLMSIKRALSWTLCWIVGKGLVPTIFSDQMTAIIVHCSPRQLQKDSSSKEILLLDWYLEPARRPFAIAGPGIRVFPERSLLMIPIRDQVGQNPCYLESRPLGVGTPGATSLSPTMLPKQSTWSVSHVVRLWPPTNPNKDSVNQIITLYLRFMLWHQVLKMTKHIK